MRRTAASASKRPKRRKALARGARISVNVYEAKTRLSELLRRVEAGDEVTIARDGAPVVRLQRVQAPPRSRVWGRDEGAIRIAPDFDALGSEWDPYVR